MTHIKTNAYQIPRTTSQLIVTPAYEKPLLQIRYNTGQADRAKWVQELAQFPAGIPESAKVVEKDMEVEMQRLAAQYGVETFRKAYPTDEMFERAFQSCESIALPQTANMVPDMDSTPESLVEEFVELRVPTLDVGKAAKLVKAGLQVDTIAMSDVRSVASLTGLPSNLIRSTIEAAKARPAPSVPRGAPSAPSELRATVEAPAS